MPIRKKSDIVLESKANTEGEGNQTTTSENTPEIEKRLPQGEDNMTEGVDLSEFQPTISESKSRMPFKGASALSIVNSEKNGKRLVISKAVMERLGNPENLQILMSADSIAIAEKLPKCKISYNVKSEKSNEIGEKTIGKGLIYAGPLVKEITDNFNLDFRERVSISFPDVTYTSIAGYPVAVIKITSKNSSEVVNDVEEVTEVNVDAEDATSVEDNSETAVLKAESCGDGTEITEPTTGEA